MVSVIAYAGLRAPEKLLALHVRHVGRQTLLVEQRNIDGEIVAGQKVRGFHPRAVDLVEPLRRDISAYLLAMGIRSGLRFPRAAAGSSRCRPTTCATPSRRCRSAPACRCPSWPSSSATHRR